MDLKQYLLSYLSNAPHDTAVDTTRPADISKLTLRVTVGVFFGFAIASVIARIGLRIHARRSLYLDDYIVLLGAMCLCATIGFVYEKCDFNFLVYTLQINPSLISKASADQIQDLLNTPFAVIYAFLALSWTAIFAVKFSFLVFFKKLINRVTDIHTYFWIVAIVNLLSWLFMITEPLVLCRHPNKTFVECLDPSRRRVYASMSWLGNSLDVLTDILIVSIPVILLRRAKIRRRQKLAVGFFLCLSTVMIVLAIVRMCRISYSGRGTDPIWQIFWQTLESCVALLMASITAFRTIFGEPGQKRWEPSYSWIQRAKQRQTSKEGDPWHTDQLPIIPEATFANMKMPVRGQQRTAEGSATPGSETRPSNSEDEPSLSVKGGQQDQNV